MADTPGYVVDAPAPESVTADGSDKPSAEIQAFPRRLVLVTRRRFPVLPSVRTLVAG
jgi:hypothetical protein